MLSCMNLRLFEIDDISDSWVSGQSLINENCDTSRASTDTDRKPGPETNNDKRNTVKKLKITLYQLVVGHSYFSELETI